MTDVARIDWSTPQAAARRKRRYSADRRLQFYGIAAISLAVGLLGILIVSLVVTGYTAFLRTMVTIDFPIPSKYVDAADPAEGNYRAVVRDGLRALFPDVTGPAERQLGQILTSNAQFIVRDAVVADPSVVGATLRLAVPASDPFDQLNKGTISRDVPENQRRVSDRQIEWFDQLVAEGRVTTPFNWGLFFNADSRFPELAGLAGAIVGSYVDLVKRRTPRSGVSTGG